MGQQLRTNNGGIKIFPDYFVRKDIILHLCVFFTTKLFKIMIKDSDHRILLVRFILGRETARRYPLNQDQYTRILTVEQTGVGNGMMIEVIPAVEKYGRTYTVVTMPDGEEKLGNIIYKPQDYERIESTKWTRLGLIKMIEKHNLAILKQIRSLQKPKKSVEHYIETFD
jgi:hypothetical protein